MQRMGGACGCASRRRPVAEGSVKGPAPRAPGKAGKGRRNLTGVQLECRLRGWFP